MLEAFIAEFVPGDVEV
jgi:hypothetical protein